MGRPKAKNPKAKRLALKKGLAVETRESKFSIDQILEKAQENLDQYDYEMAQKFCQRALEMNPDHAKALELTSTLLLEAGEVEDAKHCLGRAITVQPDEGFSKYFSMAQLLGGQEALELYRKGIEVLTQARDKATEEAEAKDLTRDLSNAYCSMAELFMTDLCDETEAEEDTLRCIRSALDVDKRNPEAFQTKARYLLVREKFEEAKDTMKQSLELWLPAYQGVLENKLEVVDFDPVEVCSLLYTTRIGTSKMLIEMEMWEEAIQVLEGLLEEDDSCVETWYLLGWLNKLRAMLPDGEVGYNANARFYLQKAKKVHTMNPTQDADMISHIDEILVELGPNPNPDEDEDDEAENWEDVESSSDEEDEVANMES
ncbi:hypothetical protein TCAL_06603 [Tigriopus californicus]|uniref:Uncharacterized protein n=1 Tax=Tigriopus californicus TaxID=6832 RepID=A0A553PNT3_TIGCA|nr:uncharacterized protein LOC131882713 [Tigriopus californicus]TRY79336.1 hypothetical protein TCAL_06603 [Tigriopus californicus]